MELRITVPLSHLCLFLRHHVQLLLPHPGLRLCCVGVELLGTAGVHKASVTLVRLGNQLVPEVLQLHQPLLQHRLPLPVNLTLSLAPLVDVIDAGLVALDLLL